MRFQDLAYIAVKIQRSGGTLPLFYLRSMFRKPIVHATSCALSVSLIPLISLRIRDAAGFVANSRKTPRTDQTFGRKMARRWVTRQARFDVETRSSWTRGGSVTSWSFLVLRERKQTWPRSSWMKFKSATSSQPTRGIFATPHSFRSDTPVSETRVFLPDWPRNILKCLQLLRLRCTLSNIETFVRVFSTRNNVNNVLRYVFNAFENYLSSSLAVKLAAIKRNETNIFMFR